MPWVIGAVAAVVVLGGGAALVYVGIRFAMGVEAPMPAEGFGNPVAENAADGWLRYRFVDLGIEVELPSEALPDPSKYERLEGLVTRRYAEYKSEGESVEVYLYGYGYRAGMTSTAREIADASKDSFASDREFSAVRSTRSGATIAGRSAIEHRMTYRFEGEDREVTELIFACKQSSIQIFVYDYTPDKSGLERVKRTIRFLETSTLEEN